MIHVQKNSVHSRIYTIVQHINCTLW